ncbi:HopJ type III effector protein [Thiomicrospira sp. ALE5]|uniref:HopJ type III effector protein n=1 Tax=Thiomicrospira sp. ALE5 TaxID=748650 RepID=UPI0008F1108C|nr:HopJ type III effector protein [Thiomicrospira sp. ALE5]SFR50328.1 HopJ type III effector protein [Thiomicrospira sp. ALE5]
MSNTLSPSELIQQLHQGPVAFNQVIATIEHYYTFTPTKFVNGSQANEAGQNNGSCKIFAFAKWHNLDSQTTLNAFGDFYTHDVLGFPDATDHQNIRQFMLHGWAGIRFSDEALKEKA